MARVFPVEASFSGWQGTDGFQFGAILRDISVRKREAERIRYLAEHDTLTGLINRNTLHARLDANDCQRRSRWAPRSRCWLSASTASSRSTTCSAMPVAISCLRAISERADGGDAGDGSWSRA